MEKLRRQIEHRFGKGLSEEAIQVVTRVDPLFLTRTFNAICSRHGSLEAYADRELNCSPEKVEAIKQELAAPPLSRVFTIKTLRFFDTINI